MQLSLQIRTYTTFEVFCIKNPSTEVVTAIDMVTNPRESQHILTLCIHTITSDVGLCVSEDVGVTRTCKAVEDTSVTQIDDGIAGDRCFEGTTIDKLRLSHIVAVFCMSSVNTCHSAFQIDVTAVSWVVLVDKFALF